ncbi:MAG: 2,4-dichlorophenol 6-monooxygenase [Subtercola sp.]|nr:2,4-dichlorophenol 6-monooxygenase [Subtercola sp.]
MTEPTYDTDVLVVGTGPMGAASALALATYGVKVRAVTRYQWVSNTPRAHITNQRTMEVLRDLGLEQKAVNLGSAWNVMGDTLFATSLAGDEIARIRTWGTGDSRQGDYITASPSGMLDLPQSQLEPLLLGAAAERGAVLSFMTEYLRHEQDADGVTVFLRDRLDDREYSVRARYLIGADGARSAIVEQLGLPLEGEMGRATTAYVRFSADLSRYVEHRPSILYWMLTPAAAYGDIGMGLLRAVHPWTEWIAGWGYDSAQGDPDFSVAAVTAKIRELVGDPELTPEIIGTSTWQVNQAYALTFDSGRVFCGGDAVHRHPPSGGLGSNTCIQDAFNLAWKLAFVIAGHAGAALLDSYSAERVPVARQVVDRANRSRLEFAAFREALATSAAGGAGGAPGRESGDATGDVPAGDPTATLLATVRQGGPAGVAVRDALTAAMQLKNYEFNAQGVELNQRYVSAAMLPEPGAADEQWPRDRELYAQPSSRPGAHLPHAWLVGPAGTRVSTLDVVGHGDFVLLTGLSGTAWVEAVDALDRPYLRSVQVDAPGALDLYGDWRRVSGIHEAGALLVRPDGYIAWRSVDPVWDAAGAQALLREVLDAILGG